MWSPQAVNKSLSPKSISSVTVKGFPPFFAAAVVDSVTPVAVVPAATTNSINSHDSFRRFQAVRCLCLNRLFFLIQCGLLG